MLVKALEDDTQVDTTLFGLFCFWRGYIRKTLVRLKCILNGSRMPSDRPRPTEQDIRRSSIREEYERRLPHNQLTGKFTHACSQLGLW